MEQIIQTVQNLDWSPLYISLKTGIAATIVSFFLGIAAARCALKASPFAKAVLDGIFTLPLVLLPTVAGFLLLLLFWRKAVHWPGFLLFCHIFWQDMIFR